ncbi:inactive pancreatic lipase-related protein 1 [Amyelois transitella]|uniref:inactive pancreatic lipase-related protein 1 n=1 Tax=Amyelois transitella TaxID=680683 RepID=UPI00067D3A05|nr:inactive pancreatic lipase-related protein 1 [Amyelois transitella]
MIRSVFVLAIALAIATGDSDDTTPSFHRNGEFNRYYLYNSRVNGQQMSLTTQSSDIIQGVTTVVIVHGHEESYQTSLNPDLRRELLESQNVNVIAVDWSIIASLSYSLAQNSVLSVGEYMAGFLALQNINPASLHLVGFNLGAHVVGVAGRRLGRVARITALDPSMSNVRLTSTDANYVEVIHTDGSSNGLGVQIGHADFFPNGGGSQPGCWGNDACSHNRAWLYFVASIRDNTFNARCCRTIRQKNLDRCRGAYLPMGGNELIKTPCSSGIYRVNTRSSYPY